MPVLSGTRMGVTTDGDSGAGPSVPLCSSASSAPSATVGRCGCTDPLDVSDCRTVDSCESHGAWTTVLEGTDTHRHTQTHTDTHRHTHKPTDRCVTTASGGEEGNRLGWLGNNNAKQTNKQPQADTQTQRTRHVSARSTSRVRQQSVRARREGRPVVVGDSAFREQTQGRGTRGVSMRRRLERQRRWQPNCAPQQALAWHSTRAETAPSSRPSPGALTDTASRAR